METRKPNEIPAEIEEVRQQFENWRSTHAGRSRIPETMWASAVKLAHQYGLHRTAKALRLDYVRLKALVGGGGEEERSTFVELLAPPDRPSECVVELENGRGKKMRIHLPAAKAPDLIALSRRFWSSKA